MHSHLEVIIPVEERFEVCYHAFNDFVTCLKARVKVCGTYCHLEVIIPVEERFEVCYHAFTPRGHYPSRGAFEVCYHAFNDFVTCLKARVKVCGTYCHLEVIIPVEERFEVCYHAFTHYPSRGAF
ncbi:hypothetical protein OIU74_015408 [Salix koriyanagi]|uniref:Uncharacterized protein n=1 Tax=Salix koriyanagi TaxID=2511006 RepID=A0A9Q0PXY7_9ROSI|nr:hypothetical protein OIU74_015408 [Salix koriyanagi]